MCLLKLVRLVFFFFKTNKAFHFILGLVSKSTSKTSKARKTAPALGLSVSSYGHLLSARRTLLSRISPLLPSASCGLPGQLFTRLLQNDYWKSQLSRIASRPLTLSVVSSRECMLWRGTWTSSSMEPSLPSIAFAIKERIVRERRAVITRLSEAWMVIKKLSPTENASAKLQSRFWSTVFFVVGEKNHL